MYLALDLHRRFVDGGPARDPEVQGPGLRCREGEQILPVLETTSRVTGERSNAALSLRKHE